MTTTDLLRACFSGEGFKVLLSLVADGCAIGWGFTIELVYADSILIALVLADVSTIDPCLLLC